MGIEYSSSGSLTFMPTSFSCSFNFPALVCLSLPCMHIAMYRDDVYMHVLHTHSNNSASRQWRYSKTSNNGPSEKRTTSIQRTELMPLIDFPIHTVHLNLRERTPPNSGQRSHLVSLSSNCAWVRRNVSVWLR